MVVAWLCPVADAGAAIVGAGRDSRASGAIVGAGRDSRAGGAIVVEQHISLTGLAPAAVEVGRAGGDVPAEACMAPALRLDLMRLPVYLDRHDRFRDLPGSIGCSAARAIPPLRGPP